MIHVHSTLLCHYRFITFPHLSYYSENPNQIAHTRPYLPMLHHHADASAEGYGKDLVLQLTLSLAIIDAIEK